MYTYMYMHATYAAGILKVSWSSTMQKSRDRPETTVSSSSPSSSHVPVTRYSGMRGCICKNERGEILLVGRKTSDRVGIHAEVLDYTQMHVYSHSE